MASCLFCQIVAGELAAHVVAETPDAVAFLDRAPVFKGHLLVVPRRHYDTLGDLPPEQVGPLFELVRRLSLIVPEVLGAHGTWTANNNTISQSVPHLHVHVVPRRKGDGLRGFFWPRQKYAGVEEMADYASRLADGYSARFA
jgi:histidine triad (HIT) family protein